MSVETKIVVWANSDWCHLRDAGPYSVGKYRPGTVVTIPNHICKDDVSIAIWLDEIRDL